MSIWKGGDFQNMIVVAFVDIFSLNIKGKMFSFEEKYLSVI